MGKTMKWIGVGVGSLIGLVLIILAIAYFSVSERLNRTYDIQPNRIPIPDRVTASEDELPIVMINLCRQCHGENLEGQIMVDDAIAHLASANLTSGQGGIGNEYTDMDWIRALKHGVDPEGKPLILMPAQVIGKLSDKDLVQIIAYMKNLPPVDNDLPESDIKPLGRAMLLPGLIPSDALPAEIIDHESVGQPEVPRGANVEYGEYIASVICVVCHGEDLAGGELEGEGRNITPAGDIGNWSEEDFINTLRTGVTPDGETLENEEMPWEDLRALSDDDLRAIWLYLQTIPPVETPEEQSRFRNSDTLASRG